MKYQITRHFGKEDSITDQSFYNYDDAYDSFEVIYADLRCLYADYEGSPYYETI